MRQSGYINIGGDYCEDGDGIISCQDCGNKAKKDCHHMRCRTCCRNRGFPCETHVKSTWVSAARRRERQNSSNQLSLMISSGNDGGSGGPEHHAKRLRDDSQHHHHQAGVVVPSTNLQNTSSELGFHFPTEVSSPALFRRVRVSGIDETNEQIAYQTAISVGGHVFNGVLYDHGPDQGQYNHPVGEGSSATGGQHHDVNLVMSGTTATTSNNNTIYQAVTVIDPSSVYPTPLCAFMGGTQFFPPPRS
ncbi:hypothetical protein QVD17_10532 [Tagetes erecta]|uniref:Uncharacterized protein n=1 Tax=Tagetes erecta TaxID=13708 RepID=A0AAD8L1A0_TARER|nr:hypothetical protein QVD17_10532 [Tagetes erecta]